MSESADNLPDPNIKWPWFVLAADVLAGVLAVVWIGYSIKHEREQRDFSAPLPNSAPTR